MVIISFLSLSHPLSETAALRRGLTDEGAQARGHQGLAPPGHHLGDDAGVPRAARGRDGPGDETRKNCRQVQPPPQQPASEAQILRRFAHVGGIF